MSAHMTILDGRLTKLETDMSNITTVVGRAPQLEATVVASAPQFDATVVASAPQLEGTVLGENDDEGEIVVEAWTGTDSRRGEMV